MNQFNQKGSQQDDDSHNDGNEQMNWLGRLQQRARPFYQRLRRWRIKLDQGAILRKRITVLTLLSLMFISLVAGKLLSPPTQVIATAPNVKKEFLSGETISMQKTAYDEQSHTARLDLETSSPTGVVSPQDLSVNFSSLKPPDSKLPSPQLYMVPTINNHFIVVIRNIYPGFEALEMLFHNHGNEPLAQYQNALSGGSNGVTSNVLSDDADSLASDTHIGAPHLSRTDKDTLLSNSASATTQDHQHSLLKNLQQKDQQLIVIKQNAMFANKDSIPSTLDPKDISIDDINSQVHSLRDQINDYENDIRQNNVLLKKMKKQSTTLSKDATVDKNYNNEINRLNGNIDGTQQSIQNDQNEITRAEQQINSYNDEINQIKNDRITFNAPVKQNSNQFSSH